MLYLSKLSLQNSRYPTVNAACDFLVALAVGRPLGQHRPHRQRHAGTLQNRLLPSGAKTASPAAQLGIWQNGVFYLLQDHLKSSSSFVNQSGATLANNYYYPYGGNRGGAFSNLTTKRFTGQYHKIDSS
jgi:hypothetical protein